MSREQDAGARVCQECKAPLLQCRTVRRRGFRTRYEYACSGCGYETSYAGWTGIAVQAVIGIGILGAIGYQLALGTLDTAGTFYIYLAVVLALVADAGRLAYLRHRFHLQPLAPSS